MLSIVKLIVFIYFLINVLYILGIFYWALFIEVTKHERQEYMFTICLACLCGSYKAIIKAIISWLIYNLL